MKLTVKLITMTMKTPCFSLGSDNRSPRPPERFNPSSEQHEYQTTQRPGDWEDDDNNDSNDDDDQMMMMMMTRIMMMMTIYRRQGRHGGKWQLLGP